MHTPQPEPVNIQLAPVSFPSTPLAERLPRKRPYRPYLGWTEVCAAAERVGGDIRLHWCNETYPIHPSLNQPQLPYREGEALTLELSSHTSRSDNIEDLKYSIARFEMYWDLFSHAPREAITVSIENRLGLHARASHKVKEIAAQFSAMIAIFRWWDGELLIANARSIMAVASLAAGRGTQLEVRAIGSDAQEAAIQIAKIVKLRFGESE
jgi:phosphocarrier protein HPr